jgi:hypothetical protein
MLKLIINNTVADIPTNVEIRIDYSSPIFNQRGTRSFPFSLPFTPTNDQILSFFHNEQFADQPADLPAKIFYNETCQFDGTITIEKSDTAYQCNLKAGKGEFAALTSGKKLTDIEYSELLVEATWHSSQWFQYMNDTVHNYNADSHFIFFPMYMPKWDSEVDLNMFPESDIYNLWNATTESFYKPNNQAGDYGYYQYAPQPFVWWIIEMLFQQFGYSISTNAFKTDTELRKKVLFNYNNYNIQKWVVGVNQHFGMFFTCEKDLPEITIADFITSIENKFFVKFIVNDINKTAQIVKLKDILLDTDSISIEKFSDRKTKYPNEKKGIQVTAETTVYEGIELKKEIGTVIATIENMTHAAEVGNTDYNQYIFIENENRYRRVTINGWEPDTYNFCEYSGQNAGITLQSKVSTLLMYYLNRNNYNFLPRYDFARTRYQYSWDMVPPKKTELIILTYHGLIEFKPENNDIWTVNTYSDLPTNVPVNTYAWVVSEQQMYKYITFGGGNMWVESNEVITNARYPYASSYPFYCWNNTPSEYWIIRIANANLSDFFNCDYGIINQLAAEYIHWLTYNYTIERQLFLEEIDIHQLAWEKKYSIENANYLLDTIPVTYRINGMEVGEVKMQRV